MADLITYRLHQVTRFISGLELKNGSIMVDYLNMDLTNLEEVYNHLIKYRNAIVEKDGYDFTKINKQLLNDIKQCCQYIDDLCLNNLPYSQMNLKPSEDNNISTLSEIRFSNSVNDRYHAARNLDLLFDYYISLCEGILRVKFYHAEFITDYYYRYGIPKNAHDSVKPYIEYETYLDKKYKNKKVPVYYRNAKIKYSDSQAVIIKTDLDGSINQRLWQQLEYRHVGDFLFSEFSDLLRGKLAIKKCINCGKYFVMNSHYNTDYCNNIAPNETSKTCREIGAQNVFNEKVKNDPILLSYRRAYKTHYARINKGKLSKADFLTWVDNANDLKQKALCNEIDFNYYLNEIAK